MDVAIWPGLGSRWTQLGLGVGMANVRARARSRWMQLYGQG